MNAGTTLLSVGSFRLAPRHLLVIGVLSLSFSISFMLRSMPLEHGFELNEFDPFYNYRATSFLVDNGYGEYLDWHDFRSWHPTGRDISATSQSMLHVTAAATYGLFGGGSTLYDFTIMFPVVIGSLTAIVVFACVRVIGGTTAGLLAALFYSVSAPVIIRGMAGWFKSEPLGLFYGILGLYLLLSGIRSGGARPPLAAARLAAGGLFLSFGLSSWGGDQFFALPIGAFFLVLPFLNDNRRFQIWAAPLFTASLMLSLLIFERPGISFVTGLGGFALAGPTAFLVACNLVMMFSPAKRALRNGLLFLGGTMAAGIGLIATSFAAGGLIGIPSFRYLNALNPSLVATHPLIDSVSEHATTTIQQSFYFHSVLMVFAGLGIWLMLGRRAPAGRREMYAFALIMGIAGVYTSSAFVRLEIFASLAVITLAALGISALASQVMGARSLSRPRQGRAIASGFVAGMVVLLLVPLVMPAQQNWSNAYGVPPTILNGGASFASTAGDWPAALEWLRTSTPEDSVVASWWDYGYWITTVGERISMVDNATLSARQIEEMARILLADPDAAWHMLREAGAGYVLVFVSAQRLESENDIDYYHLAGGGEESKKIWFMRIGGHPVERYLEIDNTTPKPAFWDTLVGGLFPYTVAGYVDHRTLESFTRYQPGTSAVYVKDVKYPAEGDGPFRLAFASPSYEEEGANVVLGVFIYEVNPDYESPAAASAAAGDDDGPPVQPGLFQLLPGLAP